MADDADRERRIREKAHQLWEQEGRPHGRADDHWEKARVLIAIEDDRTSLIPVAPQRPEEADIQANLGEFPAATTDEGDRQQTPSRDAKPKAGRASASRLRDAFRSRRR